MKRSIVLLTFLIVLIFVSVFLQRLGPAYRADRFGFVGFFDCPLDDLGLGWVRPHPGPFIWGQIERKPSVFDFSKSDDVVRRAQEKNVKILATIWPFSDWGSSGGNAPRLFDELPLHRGKPKDYNTYRVFVRKLVERYDGDGIEDMPGLSSPIKYWEVGNEPETVFFEGSPEDYAEILCITYEEIKKADPGAKVLLAGAAPPPPDPEEEEMFMQFWKRVLEEGTGCFDIISVHLNDPSEFNVVSSLFQGYPIWITEYSPCDYEGYENIPALFASGAEKIFLVSYAEIPRMPEPMRKAALLDSTLKPKEQYYLVKKLTRTIGNFKTVRRKGESIVFDDVVWDGKHISPDLNVEGPQPCIPLLLASILANTGLLTFPSPPEIEMK